MTQPQQTKARTAGPWNISDTTKEGHVKISGPSMHGLICTVGNGENRRLEFEANAAFIVQACNAHDDLVAALEDSWKLIAELEDAVDKGLKLLPHDTARITACCEAARAALVLANPKPSGAQT